MRKRNVFRARKQRNHHVVFWSKLLAGMLLVLDAVY